MRPFNLKEYLKNPSRKVVTRDGRAVKICCTDYVDGPVIAKIEDDVFSHSFREDGRYVDYKETDYDLFFATEKHEGWVNIFKGEDFYHTFIYNSKEDAEKQGETFYNYVTTIKIEWEE